MSNLGDVFSKLVYLNVSKTGAKPPAAGQFLLVFEKKKLF